MYGGFRRKIDSYKPPAVDGPRARANALFFLLNTKSVDELTAEQLAKWQRLKVATAEKMLADERARRAAR